MSNEQDFHDDTTVPEPNGWAENGPVFIEGPDSKMFRGLEIYKSCNMKKDMWKIVDIVDMDDFLHQVGITMAKKRMRWYRKFVWKMVCYLSTRLRKDTFRELNEGWINTNWKTEMDKL